LLSKRLFNLHPDIRQTALSGKSTHLMDLPNHLSCDSFPQPQPAGASTVLSPSSPLPEHGPPAQSETRLTFSVASDRRHSRTPRPPVPTARSNVPSGFQLGKEASTPLYTVSASREGSSASDIFDLTNFDGFSYPEGFPTVTWVGGKFKTALPYIPDHNNPSVNLLKCDEIHIRALAQTALLESRSVEHLKYETFQHDINAAAAINDALKIGRTVVMKGYPFLPASVDVSSLFRRFNFQALDPVVVSDAAFRLENPTHPHLFMTLANFCAGIHDNTRVQCILDAPTLDGERLPLIKFLDDGHTSYIRKHNRYSKRQNLHLDVQKSASWVLIHQGLYHTYAHHDANGYLTWTQVLSGFKIWVIIRPENHDTDQTRKDLVNTADKLMIAEPNEKGFYRTKVERTVIFAGPGDLIIMPPGTFHEVYTPVPSVTLGGHMYSYNTLHLTELALSLDKATKEKFTNQSHPSTIATIQSMMAVLPTIKDRRMCSHFYYLRL
jgi:hypothetical protein